MNRILKKIMVVCLFSCLLVLKVKASTPAQFELQGTSSLKQGETTTYNMVVTDGDAILLTGNLSFFNSTNKKALEFIKFNSEIGMIYDSTNDLLYISDKNGHAVSVNTGDIIATITVKAKEDASLGTYKLLDNEIRIEEKINVPQNNDQDKNNPNISVTTIILFSIIGVLIIILLIQKSK